QVDVDAVVALGRRPDRRRLRPGRGDHRAELRRRPGRPRCPGVRPAASPPGRVRMLPSPVDGATPPGGAVHRTKIPPLVATLVRSARDGLRRSRRCAPGRDDGPPPRLAVPPFPRGAGPRPGSPAHDPVDGPWPDGPRTSLTRWWPGLRAPRVPRGVLVIHAALSRLRLVTTTGWLEDHAGVT